MLHQAGGGMLETSTEGEGGLELDQFSGMLEGKRMRREDETYGSQFVEQPRRTVEQSLVLEVVQDEDQPLRPLQVEEDLLNSLINLLRCRTIPSVLDVLSRGSSGFVQ